MSVPRAFTPAPPSAPSVTCPARSETSRGNTCQTGARRAPRALESVEKVVTTSDNTRCRRPGGHVSARQAATDRWWPFIGFLTTDVYECQLMLTQASWRRFGQAARSGRLVPSCGDAGSAGAPPAWSLRAGRRSPAIRRLGRRRGQSAPLVLHPPRPAPAGRARSAQALGLQTSG